MARAISFTMNLQLLYLLENFTWKYSLINMLLFIKAPNNILFQVESIIKLV